MKVFSKRKTIEALKAELVGFREDLIYWKHQVTVRQNPAAKDTAKGILTIIQLKIDNRTRRIAALKQL